MHNRKRGKTLEQRRRQRTRDRKMQVAIKKKGLTAVEKLPIRRPETGSRRSGAKKLPAKTRKKQRLLNKRKGGNNDQPAGSAAMEI